MVALRLIIGFYFDSFILGLVVFEAPLTVINICLSESMNISFNIYSLLVKLFYIILEASLKLILPFYG